MLQRHEYKKRTIKGLDELCAWSEEELQYNQVHVDAFHEKIVVPCDMELRKNEYCVHLQSKYSEACLEDWSSGANLL